MKYRKSKHLSYVNMLYPAFTLYFVFMLILILMSYVLSI